jgi:hypothetical protein
MAARAAKDEKWSQSRACLQEAISLDYGSTELSRFLEAVESAEINGGGTISGEDAIEKLESLLARNRNTPAGRPAAPVAIAVSPGGIYPWNPAVHIPKNG